MSGDRQVDGRSSKFNAVMPENQLMHQVTLGAGQTRNQSFLTCKSRSKSKKKKKSPKKS